MIPLNKFIKQYDPLKLTERDRNKLIELDKKYGDLIMEVREKFNEKDVENLDEEREKFFDAYKRGVCYLPKLKLQTCKYTRRLLNDLIQLRYKFCQFSKCALSPYYIQYLDVKIKWVNYHLMRREDKLNKIMFPIEQYPSDSIYQKAVSIIRNTEYKSTKKLNRNIDAVQAKGQIQQALDELGYDWEVRIEPNMLARMNVLPNNIIRISKDAFFNEADIEGLIAHEIKGHIARRHYAQKIGLNLFKFGLKGNNVYDEGLAVWNSLNLVKKEKPNVMFNIALKFIVGYNKYRMSFYELFDYIKKIDEKNQLPDSVIFNCIARGKREIYDMSILGGVPDDSKYLEGYELVKNMKSHERNDILKYNIGPEQYRDLDKIKRFLKINNFSSLT